MSEGPFFFGPADRRLFGWLHPPASGARPATIGVVICNPFGFEAICTHRSMRHVAEAFAATGVPTLRFDYDGTGDSAGDDRDPDRVAAWLASVHAAIDALRERTGTGRVALLGLRLGATLAATAATTRTDVAALIALVPVLEPALYLRELQGFQAWARLTKSPDGDEGIGAGDQQAAGFVLTAQTIASLTALKLDSQTQRPARRVLIVERADRAPSESWPVTLRALGAEVDVQTASGFVEMNWNPHLAVVPKQMIAGTVAWLLKTGLATEPGATLATATTAAAPLESSLAGGVVEHAVFIDSQRTQFGIVAHAPALARNGRAILVLNAGAQHRIGPNRMWVTLSRRWAQRGVIALRLDLSGLGDSRPRAGQDENAGYSPAGVGDIAETVEYLRREWGARHVDVVGLCGSAYHAFKAAARGVRLDSVVLINQQAFFWDPGMADSSHAIDVVRHLRAALVSRASWEKLLRGDVKLGAVSEAVRSRAFDLARRLGRRVARRLAIPIKDDLATELRAAVKNRVRLRFVFSSGDPGEQLLHELGGSIVDELQQRGEIAIEHVKGSDHTFTAVWAQRVVTEQLDGWLQL